jgi:hypothetical protein
VGANLRPSSASRSSSWRFSTLILAVNIWPVFARRDQSSSIDIDAKLFCFTTGLRHIADEYIGLITIEYDRSRNRSMVNFDHIDEYIVLICVAVFHQGSGLLQEGHTVYEAPAIVSSCINRIAPGSLSATLV